MNSEPLIPSTPLTIAWNFTYVCNMGCKHCYSRTEQGKELTQGQQTRILKKFIRAKVMNINFGGGECLMRPSFFPIAQLAKEKGIGVALSSNGWLIDDAMARRLASLKVDVVNISIDSVDPQKHDNFRGTPGSFKKAITAISLLKKQGIRVKMMSVLSKLNYQEVEELVKLAETLKVDEIELKNYKPAGKGLTNSNQYDLKPIEWKKLYLKITDMQKSASISINLGAEPILCLLKRSVNSEDDKDLVNGSPCGKLSLCVKPNGDITPCVYMNLVIGNMLKDDLAYIWKNSAILRQLRCRKPEGKCKQCSHFRLCLGGCFSNSYNILGRMDAPDPHCWWQPKTDK